MRQILFYYYNINFEILNESENIYLLEYNDNKYIFKRLVIDIDSLKNNMDVLINYHIKFHNIILNNKNELISTYKGKNFVLLKLDSSLENKWIDFYTFEVDYYEIAIGSIWENRIDYYMNFMQEKGMNDLLVIAIFNYYIGMSENAIAITNRLKNKKIKLKRTIGHKRIKYPFDYVNYYDPTEMIIDFRIRDYSEYLKSKTLKGKIDVEKECNYLFKNNYNNDEINILLARLLYPSYYFDELDKLIDNEINEEDLIIFADIIKKYENTLKQIYNYMCKFYNLYSIDWLKK